MKNWTEYDIFSGQKFKVEDIDVIYTINLVIETEPDTFFYGLNKVVKSGLYVIRSNLSEIEDIVFSVGNIESLLNILNENNAIIYERT